MDGDAILNPHPRHLRFFFAKDVQGVGKKSVGFAQDEDEELAWEEDTDDTATAQVAPVIEGGHQVHNQATYTEVQIAVSSPNSPIDSARVQEIWKTSEQNLELALAEIAELKSALAKEKATRQHLELQLNRLMSSLKEKNVDVDCCSSSIEQTCGSLVSSAGVMKIEQTSETRVAQPHLCERIVHEEHPDQPPRKELEQFILTAEKSDGAAMEVSLESSETKLTKADASVSSITLAHPEENGERPEEQVFTSSASQLEKEHEPVMGAVVIEAAPAASEVKAPQLAPRTNDDPAEAEGEWDDWS